MFLSRTTQSGEINFLLKSETDKLSDLVAKQCYFTITAKKTVPSKVRKYEDQYRGREFPGFSNYKTFEDIIKDQIRELEEPAVEILNNVIGTAQATGGSCVGDSAGADKFIFQEKLMLSLMPSGSFRVRK